MRKLYFKTLKINTLLIGGLMLMFVSNIAAQVSGVVFRDFNGDGILQTPSASYEEPGLSFVTVKAFDNANNLIGTTTTSSTGAYSFLGLTFPVRIEFSDLPTGFYSSKSGASNGSSIQFYDAATTNANFAVNLPSEYSQPSTDKIVGVQMDNGTSIALDAIYTVPYGNTGNTNADRINLSSSINLKVGAVWGLAYQPTTDMVFTSAFMRRFAAFGIGGTGAIYVTTNAKNNPSSSVTSLFINLNGMIVNNATGGTISINTGTDPHDYNNLQLDIDNANGSPFDAVGKISFGDMDISEDKKFLYVVSLNDKKLYRIEIDADNDINTKPVATDVLAYDLPSGSCVGGTSRPFGLGIRNNEVYVGTICDAGSSSTYAPTSDLTATIYKLTGASFSSVITFPMNYYRGLVSGEFRYDDDHRFRPWISTWTRTIPRVTSSLTYRAVFSQPMLSDIIFDVDGAMILGIADRFGYQAGNGVANANNSQYNLLDCRSGGDILRICNAGTLNTPNYILEGDSGCQTSTSLELTGYNDGIANHPVESEFYVGDNYDEGFNAGHTEVGFGALVMSYGSKSVVTTSLNPIDTDHGGGIFRNGFKYLSNVNGEDLNGYDISGTFGKCNGVGDLELLVELAPIEIGNRVFMDTDSDGEQDAGEMGLDGIKVELWKNGIKITETTTANGGQWYFSNVEANTDFEIKILAASFPFGKTITVKDAQTNSKDLIDNDATLVSSDAIIVYRTGSAGQNDHSLDFGFKEACNLSASASGTNVKCNTGADGTASVVATGNVGAVTYLWSNGANASSISNLIAGNYSVTVSESVNCTSIANIVITEPSNIALTCSKNDVTISGGTDGSASVAASGGTAPYSYFWSTGATTPSITNLTAGTYTVTVSDANGCSDVCSSQITEPNCNLATTASSTPVTCHGGTDGSASVATTGNIGALSYLWSNGANASSISNLLAGSYTVTITESVNCKTVSTVVIAEPSAISVTCTNTNVTTNGGTDGTADVAASGGTAPYSYLWSIGATTSSITNLTAGTYTVTVSDANGCSDVCTSQITEPNCNLVTTASSTPVTCHGGTDGSASVTTTGNIGALSYLWSNGANAPSISNLVSGTYTVTITESVNCKTVSTVVITEPSAISIICSKIDVTTSGGSNGTASVAANGGTAPYSYLWSTGATTSSMTNLTAGTYTVTVNDANGCSDVCTSQIIEPNCIPPSVGANQTLTCNANQAPTTSTLIAAPNGYTWYVLSQPNGASATISNSGAVSNMTKSGNYVFELIKDTDSGCKSSIQITAPSCTTPCPTTKCGTTSVRKL